MINRLCRRKINGEIKRLLTCGNTLQKLISPHVAVRRRGEMVSSPPPPPL